MELLTLLKILSQRASAELLSAVLLAVWLVMRLVRVLKIHVEVGEKSSILVEVGLKTEKDAQNRSGKSLINAGSEELAL